MRLPTYKQLRRFVEVEGWTDTDKAAGRKKGDHHRYVFQPPTGAPLYTRVSLGTGQIGDPDLFRAFLRDQLCVDEETFWNAVDHGVKPPRPTPASLAASGPALDAKLARNLNRRAGLPWSEIADLTQAEAVAIWQDYLTRGGA